MNNNVTSLLMPLHPDIITVLRRVEDFVKANVNSPSYKPLWLNSAMYVNVSKWCAYELIDSDGYNKPMSGNVTLGSGWYTLQTHVSHVYIGPHKGGETFSLSLYVVKICYQPIDMVDDEVTAFIQSLEPAIPVKADKKKSRRRKNDNTDPAIVPVKI